VDDKGQHGLPTLPGLTDEIDMPGMHDCEAALTPSDKMIEVAAAPATGIA
jgi:hypothetical protein